jgi:hypothetical protein
VAELREREREREREDPKKDRKKKRRKKEKERKKEEKEIITMDESWMSVEIGTKIVYASDSTGSPFFGQVDRNYLHLFQLNLPLEVILIALERMYSFPKCRTNRLQLG